LPTSLTSFGQIRDAPSAIPTSQCAVFRNDLQIMDPFPRADVPLANACVPVSLERMNYRWLKGFGIAGCLLVLPAAAHADVAPPTGYVETCTRAQQEAGAEYCELRAAGYNDPFGCVADTANTPVDVASCRSATTFNQEGCCDAWINDGWTYRCQTYGSTSYGALWCRARQQGDPARPALPVEPGEEESGGSGGCAIGRVAGGAGLCLLPLLTLVPLLRRKSRVRTQTPKSSMP
jgi:hypothetical protein